jgi:hypothetical protein
MKKFELIEKVSAGFLVLGVMIIGCSLVLGSGPYGGSGEMQSQERKVDEFHSVVTGGSEDLYVTQGSTQQLKIEAEEEVLNNLTTEVRGGVLHIGYRHSFNVHGPVTIRVTMKEVKRLELTGSGSIKGQSRITTDEIELGISGSGNIDMELEANHINTGISGSGHVTLSGKTSSHKVKISGSGEVRALDLAADSYSISISGSGNGKINVSSKLDVRISGSGDVLYKGSPGEVNVSAGGSGSVRKISRTE